MKLKKVIVAPLNWGLGHATRVISIIDSLQKNNFSVIIAADGNALRFLKQEFPHLQFVQLPDVNINYSKNYVFLKIFIQIPKIFIHSFIEHFKLKSFLKKQPVDLIISDNRYGVWSKRAYNIFISHQYKIKLPKNLSFLSFIYPYVIKRCLKPYDVCWVPDMAGSPNLSGDLSHNIPLFSSLKYIGVLSRFKRYLYKPTIEKKYDLLVILSGPEPQRTIFEQMIFSQIKETKYKVAIVRGIEQKETVNASADVFDVVHSESLFYLIKQSKWVVCRAGYSSIMDLYVSGAKAILVPTPGQTEQEYLADYLKQKKYFYSVAQQNFCLEAALHEVKDFIPPDYADEKNCLDKLISSLRLKL